MKEAKPQRLHILLFYSYDILEKAKQQRKKTAQGVPGVGRWGWWLTTKEMTGRI